MLMGKVIEAKYAYQRITYVKPMENHYEDVGEKPYIKYNCPVCESLGNKHSLSTGISNCPLCNVNLLWEEQENIQVYQLCECDAVAAKTLDQAIEWYMNETGLTKDDLYPLDEIELVPMDRKVMDDGEGVMISVQEIVNRYWKGKPFRAITTDW